MPKCEMCDKRKSRENSSLCFQCSRKENLSEMHEIDLKYSRDFKLSLRDIANSVPALRRVR
jgi:hypothetical protein